LGEEMLMVGTETTRVPSFVGAFNPLVHRLLRIGIRLGPNALITIRGRKSGLPRTTPVALVEHDGRRWVQSPFGEVDWVRNLRAAAQATLTLGRRREEVKAVELSVDEAATFFAEVVGPYVHRLLIGRFLIGSLGARDILEDPVGAGRRYPVFELHAIPPQD
jgi:deazaflavin-dependent oxidoreductase (nitroreductase family)